MVAESGLRFAILRPTMILGPGAPIRGALEKLALLPAIVMPGTGRVRVQPIHVDDVVRAIVSVVNHDRFSNATFELGGADVLSGDLPVTELFTLGGIRTFPGLRPGELRGSSYWTTAARYSWRLVELSPLSGQALYAGVRVQAAEMRKRFDGLEPEIIYGLSGSIGGRTPVGPFLFSLGYVDGGEWQLQFMLGRPVAEGSLFDEVQ